MDFKIDPKLYDTLNDEQKELLNETLNQHKVVTEKELNKQFLTEKDKLKNEWEQEQEAKLNIIKEKESFLSKVPEQNKTLINDLLELGKTENDIQTNYAHLLQEHKPITIIDDLFTSNQDQIQAKAIQTDAEYAKEVRSKAIDPDTLSKDELDKYLAGCRLLEK
jgi:hypothetical protein